MINGASLLERVTWTKNLVTDQTGDGLSEKIGTATPAFDATEGYGAASSTSMVTLVNLCAPPGWNFKMSAYMKWVAPTTVGNEEIGVLAALAFDTIGATDYTTYYYARMDGQVAKLTKVIDTAFTNLATSAYALAVDTLCTIHLQGLWTGSAWSLSCGFAANGGSPADLALSASDSAIPGTFPLQLGFRSLSSSMWCRTFTAETWK